MALGQHLCCAVSSFVLGQILSEKKSISGLETVSKVDRYSAFEWEYRIHTLIGRNSTALTAKQTLTLLLTSKIV